MRRKVNILFTSILIIICHSFLYAENKNFKWDNISGKWQIGQKEKDTFLENNGKFYRWEYSEIINFNSILTMNSIAGYSIIKFNIEISDPILSPVEIMLPFSLKDFRNFYAFKFVIDNYWDNELLFISSKIKDLSLDKSVKKNFTITKLQKKNFSLEFDRNYDIEIRIDKNAAVLYIDGKKEMEAQASEDLPRENLACGRIGFSSRNTKVRIRNVKIYNGEKTVFEDDFSAESIKRWTVKATPVKSNSQ